MAKQRFRQKKTPLIQQTVKLLSFPESILPGVPYIELQGDSSLAITGYEALLLYDENSILFRMKAPSAPHFTHLRITGSNLTLTVLREGCLSVQGCIDAVILHPRDISLS